MRCLLVETCAWVKHPSGVHIVQLSQAVYRISSTPSDTASQQPVHLVDRVERPDNRPALAWS